MEKNLLNLSKRETQILSYLKNGLSSKEIASNLSLSSHTVDTHRRNMLRKANTRNSVELVLLGLQMGVI